MQHAVAMIVPRVLNFCGCRPFCCRVPAPMTTTSLAFAPALHPSARWVIPHTPQPADRSPVITGRSTTRPATARSPSPACHWSRRAVAWAIAHPSRTVAVLAALPAWTGKPTPPLVALARSTRPANCGATAWATTTRMRESSPPWLADELNHGCGSVAGSAGRHDGGGGVRRTDHRGSCPPPTTPMGVIGLRRPGASAGGGSSGWPRP